MSGLPFLTALLLAGTAVLAVGWVGAYFLRRQAAWENALWRTVWLVLLILPLAQMVGPRLVRPSRSEGSNRGESAFTVVLTGGELTGAPLNTKVKASDAWGMIRRGLLWVWGAGAVVSLVGLARDAWKVRRWVQVSPMVVGKGCEMLMGGARMARVRPPELRVASGLHSPVLVGWRRPCILVPSPEVAQEREVLLHELAHLRRADLWWMTLGRIVCAGWWFHPLAWGVTRRLERSAENVCDDLVVVWTQDAAAYAGQLMRFARQASGAGWWPLAGAAITGFRSELGKRVERVMEPDRTLRVAVGRGTVLALTTGAALLLALVGAVSPSQGQSEVPSSQPTASRPATPADVGTGGSLTSPVAAPPAQAPQPSVAKGDEVALAAINHKLTDIIMPQIEIDGTTLRDSFRYLQMEAKRHDTDPDPLKRGVTIALAMPQSGADKRLTLILKEMTLGEALRKVADQADLQIIVEPHTVIVKAKGQ